MRHTVLKERSLTSQTEAPAWNKIQDYRDKAVQVWGTFSASYQIQGRLSPDADWVNMLTAAKTAPDIIEVTAPVQALRVVCTAFVSGTITAVFSGFNARTE